MASGSHAIDATRQRPGTASTASRATDRAQDFSQATGELTPTLKLKRATVVEKYADVLRRLYGDAQSAVWFP